MHDHTIVSTFHQFLKFINGFLHLRYFVVEVPLHVSDDLVYISVTAFRSLCIKIFAIGMTVAVDVTRVPDLSDTDAEDPSTISPVTMKPTLAEKLNRSGEKAVPRTDAVLLSRSQKVSVLKSIKKKI